MRRIVIVGLCLVWLLAACGGEKEGEQEITLTIFAASSLTDVLQEASAAYTQEHENVKIVFSFGSSSQLATQLNEGAQADLFMSANQSQMDAVKDLLQGDTQILIHNHLVLVVPKDNPAEVQTVEDMTKEGVKIVTASKDVPIRIYTDALLATYTQEVQNRFYNNVISEEPNVRQVVLKISLGEADAAIVYATDVTADIQRDVTLIELPANDLPLPTYYVGVLSDKKAAQDFADFLASEAGQEIFVKWGFIVQ